MPKTVSLSMALALGLAAYQTGPEAFGASKTFVIVRSTHENQLKPEDEQSQIARIWQFSEMVRHVARQSGEAVDTTEVRVENYRNLADEVWKVVSEQDKEVVGVYFIGHGNREAIAPARGRENYFRAPDFAPLLQALLQRLNPRMVQGPALIYFDACQVAHEPGAFLDQLAGLLQPSIQELGRPVLIMGHLANSISGNLFAGKLADELLIDPKKAHSGWTPQTRILLRTLFGVPLLAIPSLVDMSRVKLSLEGSVAVVFGSGLLYIAVAHVLRNYRRISPVRLLEAQWIRREAERQVRLILVSPDAGVEHLGPTVDLTALSGYLQGGVDGIKRCADWLERPVPKALLFD